MSNAFAPIVRARPCPIFGRPVHPGFPPIDYSPILLLKPFGFQITPDTLSSSEISRWPARHYPRLWIQRPSSERRRDFNPPDSCAAQRTLRASPPPQRARPVPHGRPVDHPDHALGLPVLRALSLCTCRRHYPGAADGPTRRSNSPIRASLPRNHYRVGLHIVLFEDCSAFTHVAACTLAQSPIVTANRRLQPFRYLHDCSDCFRRERIAGWGLHPLESAALSRRTPIPAIRRHHPKRLRWAERDIRAS